MSDRPIETAKQLWSALTKLAGLDLRRYDSSLLGEVAEALDVPASRFGHALRSATVTVEQLLSAFLCAIAPYGHMMRDILAMFARAGAASANHNIAIRFDFGHKIEGLEFDLHQFRQWERLSQHVLASCNVFQCNVQALLRLAFAFRYEGTTYTCSHGSWHAAELPRNASAREWLRSFAELGTCTHPLPPAPRTHDKQIDDLLAQTWTVLRMVQRQLASGLQDEGSASPGGDEPVGDWGGVQESSHSNRKHDGIYSADWSRLEPGYLGRIVRDAYLATERGANIFPRLREQLTSWFDSVPRPQVPVETRFDMLREFLSLPVWKRRHELYSAWVGTQLVSSLGATARVHVVGGGILYSFRGTHLATCPLGNGRCLHVWAELRTSLANPMGAGRRAAIQPDYVLTSDPITHPASSALVVECKQYLKPSKKNFTAALTDYAHGHPNANVVLVNYGPALDLAHLMPPDLEARVSIIGQFRPDSPAALATLRQLVQSSSARLRPTEQTPAAHVPTKCQHVTVRLRWGDAPKDLDLYCRVQTAGGHGGIVSYQRREYDADGARLQLDQDVTEGYGPECIELHCDGSGRYAFYVHNYSREAEIIGSGARVEVILDGMSMEVTAPTLGDGSWWYLCEIDAGKAMVRVVNKVVGETLI